MNSLDIPNAPLRSLASAYRDAAAKHGDATEAGDRGRANEAGEQISRLYSEIRRRGLAAQAQLIYLLSDPSPGVRLWSGSHALEFRSEAGEAALLELIGAGGFLGFSAEIQAGFRGADSLAEQALISATGSERAGVLINAGTDLPISIGGLLRSVPKIGPLGEPRRALNIRKDSLLVGPAIRQATNGSLAVEALTSGATVVDTVSD